MNKYLEDPDTLDQSQGTSEVIFEYHVKVACRGSGLTGRGDNFPLMRSILSSLNSSSSLFR